MKKLVTILFSLLWVNAFGQDVDKRTPLGHIAKQKVIWQDSLPEPHDGSLPEFHGERRIQPYYVPNDTTKLKRINTVTRDIEKTTKRKTKKNALPKNHL